MYLNTITQHHSCSLDEWAFDTSRLMQTKLDSPYVNANIRLVTRTQDGFRVIYLHTGDIVHTTIPWKMLNVKYEFLPDHVIVQLANGEIE